MPYINSTNPACECQLKYYYDSSTQLCEACSPLCTACDGPTSSECVGNCASLLNVNQTYLGLHNKCECNDHYFYNFTECEICHPLCTNCMSRTNLDCVTSCAISPYIVAMTTTPIQ